MSREKPTDFPRAIMSSTTESLRKATSSNCAVAIRASPFPPRSRFMVWYLTYIICNNWARDFMDTIVFGNINVALVFGLLQFVSTFAIAYFYARHANKSLDPLATELRDEFEQEAGR